MISSAKWSQLSLAQQLGNVGSEIARARHWQERHDLESRNRALARALELMDLTLDDARWQARLRELCLLREVLSDWFSGQNQYAVSLQDLETYCLQLSLRS